MATIQSTIGYTGYSKSSTYTWAGLTNGDVGAPLAMSAFADRSVQVFGSFGSGSVDIEGSNDGVNWAVLTDLQGNNLTFLTAKIEMVTEITQFIRPKCTGAGTSLTVVLLAKGES